MEDLLLGLTHGDPQALSSCTPIEGHTHRLYRHQEGVVIKVLNRIHGDEPDREWSALVHLAEAGFACTPQPIARAGDAIAMTYCPGAPINSNSESDAWESLAEAQRQLYAIAPSALFQRTRSDPSFASTNIATFSTTT